jgi:hypothetical protein
MTTCQRIIEMLEKNIKENGKTSNFRGFVWCLTDLM